MLFHLNFPLEFRSATKSPGSIQWILSTLLALPIIQCNTVTVLLEPLPNRTQRFWNAGIDSILISSTRSARAVWFKRFERSKAARDGITAIAVPDIIWVQIIWQNLFDKLLFSYDKMLIFKSVKWSTKKDKKKIKESLIRMLNTREFGLWKLDFQPS